MSTCISSEGEYSEHDLSPEAGVPQGVCRRCYAMSDAALADTRLDASIIAHRDTARKLAVAERALADARLAYESACSRAEMKDRMLADLRARIEALGKEMTSKGNGARMRAGFEVLDLLASTNPVSPIQPRFQEGSHG